MGLKLRTKSNTKHVVRTTVVLLYINVVGVPTLAAGETFDIPGNTRVPPASPRVRTEYILHRRRDMCLGYLDDTGDLDPSSESKYTASSPYAWRK